MKQPTRLTLQSMFETLHEKEEDSDKLYFDNSLGIALDVNSPFKPFIENYSSPYLLEDYRLGLVKQGYMHGILNLQEYRVEANTVIFATPGTIVEPLDLSDDFQIMGIGIPADLFHIIHSGALPEIFNGQVKHGMVQVGDKERTLLDHMFLMLWEIANSRKRQADTDSQIGASQKVVDHMLTTITHYYNDLFSRQWSDANKSTAATDIFNRFIYLVNNHCREQRQLSFYAQKICVTERYLGTVIRQTSGITAKEWIDKAVMTCAKVMLRHSDQAVNEIAERLNFSTASFFCKYFKRLEGCSPQDYRQKRP